MIAIDIGFCFENDSLYHILYCRAEEYLGVIIVTAIDRCVSAHPLSLIKKNITPQPTPASHYIYNADYWYGKKR